MIAALNHALLKCTKFHSPTITIRQFPSNAIIFGAIIRQPQIASEAATYMVANRTSHFTRKNKWEASEIRSKKQLPPLFYLPSWNVTFSTNAGQLHSNLKFMQQERILIGRY